MMDRLEFGQSGSEEGEAGRADDKDDQTEPQKLEKALARGWRRHANPLRESGPLFGRLRELFLVHVGTPLDQKQAKWLICAGQ
jgi:hypothetical protein